MIKAILCYSPCYQCLHRNCKYIVVWVCIIYNKWWHSKMMCIGVVQELIWTLGKGQRDHALKLTWLKSSCATHHIASVTRKEKSSSGFSFWVRWVDNLYLLVHVASNNYFMKYIACSPSPLLPTSISSFSPFLSSSIPVCHNVPVCYTVPVCPHMQYSCRCERGLSPPLITMQ